MLIRCLGWASFVAQLVKNPPAMRETWVRSLGWEDPLEKGKALQYSGLENSMDCIVYGFTKSQTQPSDFHSLTQGRLWTVADRGENLKAHSPCLASAALSDSLQIPQGTVGLTACLLPPQPLPVPPTLTGLFFLELFAHRSLAWGLLWET